MASVMEMQDQPVPVAKHNAVPLLKRSKSENDVRGPSSFMVVHVGAESVDESGQQVLDTIEQQKAPFFSYRTANLDRTKVSKKPIVVVNLDTDSTGIVELAKNDLITYMSKSHIVDRSEPKLTVFASDHFKELSKDIWIMVSEKTIGSNAEECVRIINDVGQLRSSAVKNAKLPPSSFPVQVMFYNRTDQQSTETLNGNHKHDKVRSLVSRLDKTDAISFTNVTQDLMTIPKITSILENYHRSRQEKVLKLLGTPSKGAFCEVEIKLVPNNSNHLSTDDVPYFQEAYSVLRDLLDDANGALRQEFHRRHRLPNIRVAEVKKDEKNGRIKMRMILELRLLNYGGLQTVENAIEKGHLAVAVEESIRIRGQPLNGHAQLKLITRNKAHIKAFFEEESRNTHASEVPMLKRIIVTNLYEKHINDPQKLPFDFWKELQKVGPMSLIDSVRNSKGENAMHMAITAGRVDFLKMIFYMDRWGVLRQEISMPSTVATSLPTHTGYTPRRLAEALAFKTKGQTILNEYDQLEEAYLKLTSLGMTCIGGRLDLVKILIKSKPSSMKEDWNSATVTSLQGACGAGHYKIVQYLAQQKVQPTEKDFSPYMAAMFGHTKVLSVLSEEWRHVDIMGRRDKENLNAIDWCAMNGDVESLKLFKEKNFPIRATSLALAVKYSRDKAVEFLREECDVDVNAGGDEDGRLAIHHAVITGDVEAVKRQMSFKADITRLDKFGKSVLHLAAEYNQDVVARLLLTELQSSGVLVNLINKKDKYTGKDQYYLVRGRDRGRRAWHWLKLHRLHINLFKSALARGQLDVAEHGTILYSGFGASPDAETNKKMKERQEESLKPGSESFDMTPLHHAANKEHIVLVKCLLEYGAEPNLHDHSGATPLHLATMRGNLDIVVALENGGANLDMLTEDGLSCRDIADKNGHQHILNFLEAKSTIKNTEFMKEAMEKVKAALSQDVLMERRSHGKDIKRHIIDALRELTIDVNTFLLQMGSGPVLEATTDS